MQTPVQSDRLRAVLDRAREVQQVWADSPISDRLKICQGLRHDLSVRARALAESLTAANPHRDHVSQTLSAEVLPVAAACRFLERSAASVLRDRRLGVRGRPAWLLGVRGVVRRVPFGVVLIIAPSNYPYMLPGVQTLQALVAGNAVLIKPGAGGTLAAEALHDQLARAGLPAGLMRVLDESVGSARQAIELGVDKIVLTGSVASGQAVLEQAARQLTPVICELSGCDAVYVLPGADLDLVSGAITFGMRLNRSRTCIAPRRVFVPRPMAEGLITRLRERFIPVEPKPTLITDGTVLTDDRFEPVVCVVAYDNLDEAIALDRSCSYALGASVFGPREEAGRVAHRVRAGSVCINDLIVPTADPRLPFGGAGDSGFGVTRGKEGLLEMTRVKTISQRSGRFRPHFEPPNENDAALLTNYLAATSGIDLLPRVRAWARMAGALLAGRPGRR